MYDSFLATLLSLALICITCLRLFFTKKAHIDPISLLAPTAFFASLCTIALWGAEPLFLLVAALSLLVFLTNVRALFRLSAQLYVDHYSILFVSFSLFELVAALALGVCTVLFRPVQYRPSDFGVTKQTQYLTGTLATGYAVRHQLFEPTRITGRLYTYALAPADAVADAVAKDAGTQRQAAATTAQEGATAPADAAAHHEAQPDEQERADEQEKTGDHKPIVLLVPKTTASAIHYEPYCLMLAQKGYTVLTADFYANTPRLYDERMFFSLDSRLFRRAHSVSLALAARKAQKTHTPQDAASDELEKNDAAVTAACYGALTRLALSQFGADAQLFYAVDMLSMEKLNPLVSRYEQNVLGFFALNRVTEYTTAGFGFVEQTDAYTAWRLGTWRDKTFFIPRYVAGKTDEIIQDAVKLLQPVEIIRNGEK